MESSDGSPEVEHHAQQLEEDTTYGLTPGQYEKLSGIASPRVSHSTSLGSNSSLVSTPSDESEIMGTARASTRHSSSQSHVTARMDSPIAMEPSKSRKNGWLSFPAAKIAKPSRRSSTDPSLDTAASQMGSASGDPRSPIPSAINNDSPGTGATPSPRTKTFEIKVKKLYYRLPPPKYTWLSKFKDLLTGNSIEDFLPPDRYILRNINFDAKPGELLGIAGPSGAGKSTLLECLAGRLLPTAGSILVNDEVMNTSNFRRISGYVMQDDALFPHLTVLETLFISARLRLPSTMTRADKLSRVQALLGELGLQHAANTRIGDDLVRGISGGERRRLSIGVDVIHDPAVLILDEPTSGLDSAAALNVTAMLRDMAVSRGRTVIVSVHQPSFRILQLMHSILLLAGGLVVHHGSLEHLAERLSVSGHEVPARTNVLEYAIDTVNSWESDQKLGNYATIAKGLTLEQILSLDRKFQGDYKLSDVERGLEIPSEKVSADGSVEGGGAGGSDDDKVSFANNTFQETIILTERFFKNILRTKELFHARSLQALLAGVILGTVFLDVDDDVKGVSDRLGFIIFTLSFLLNSTTEALPIFLRERQILMRETSRGAYRISSYALSHAVVFFPFLLIIGILYGAPSYWLIGLNSSFGNFIFFCLVLWLTLLLASSFVAFFSALVPNYIIGQGIVSAFMGAFFLFSGYIINRNEIPDYWIWMHYISLFKYPLEALLLNEFGSKRDKCYGRAKDENSNLLDFVASQCRSSSGGSANITLSAGKFCVLTGSQVLDDAGVQGHQKWVDVAAMVGFIVFYRFAGYVAVRWRLKQRQH